jgi:hypothetical protein
LLKNKLKSSALVEEKSFDSNFLHLCGRIYNKSVYFVNRKNKKITSHGVRLFINTHITTDKKWDRIVWEICHFTNNICSSFNALYQDGIPLCVERTQRKELPLLRKNALFPPNCPFRSRRGKTIAMLVVSSEKRMELIGTEKAIVIVSCARSVLSTSHRMFCASP